MAYLPNIYTKPLPMTKGVYRNADGEAISDRNYQCYDGYLNELGYHVKRPGLASFADLGLGTNVPVVGMFWWPHKSYVLAVAGGQVFKVEYIGGVSVVTALGGTALTSGITPTFTTDGTYAFIAAGGQILYTNGTTAMAAIADADAPTTVTHVDWIDGYLLAIDGTNKFFYSDLNTPLTWTATSYFSATGDADNIVAMKVLERQIYLFGSVSTEIWENVGSYPQVFRRVAGGFLNEGCSAPYSVVDRRDTIYWLNDERHFVSYSGGQVKEISTPYDKDIEAFTSVSDCVSNRVEIDGIPFLKFSFPTAARTLVLNLSNETWSEWSYYNTSTAMRERWKGNCHCYAPAWGKHLVGSRSSSVIYTLTRDNLTDIGDQINFDVVTGHIDHEILKQKRNHWLRMRAKCGARDTTTTPSMQVRWKNNNKSWSSWHTLSLGDVGETDIIRRLPKLGVYQTRQWEFSVTEPIAFSFGQVEEDIEILR